MKQKLESLQVGRGVAAFIVLLFHLQLLPRQFWPSSRLAHAFDFGGAGVDFFFALSGFLMMYVHKKDFSNPGFLITYIKKRAARIYPLYWLLCLILIPLALYLPSIVRNGGKMNFHTLFLSVLLIPHQGNRLLGVTWTLEYEVFFYLVFALFIINFRLGATLFGVWFAAIVITALFGPHYLSETGVPMMRPFPLAFALSLHSAEFIGGVFTAWVIKKGFRIRYPRTLLMVALGVDLFAASCNPLTMDHRLMIIIYGVGAVMTIGGGVFIELKKTVHFPNWLTVLGAASYSIYLSHFPTIFLIIIVVKHVHTIQTLPVLAVMIPAMVLSLIPGLLLHYVFERPFLNLLSSNA